MRAEKFREFLKSYKSGNWFYSEINDTWYTDLNNTLTMTDFPEAVIRNIDKKLMPGFYELMDQNLPRTQAVEETIKMLEDLWRSKLVIASKKATQKTELQPEIEKILPHVYPTKMAIMTGVDQYSAEIFVRNKICPLYYRDVPENMQGGWIAVVGTIHDEINGRLTGETVAVPDDGDRGVLFLIDVFASLGYTDKIEELRELTNYPCSPRGFAYKF